jgi:hypothetical protein
LRLYPLLTFINIAYRKPISFAKPFGFHRASKTGLFGFRAGGEAALADA